MEEFGYDLFNLRISQISHSINKNYIGEDRIITGFNLSNRELRSSSVLSYCISEKYLDIALKNQKVKALVIPEELYEKIESNARNRYSFIISNTPEPVFYRLFINAYKNVLMSYNWKTDIGNTIIQKGAVIEDGVILGKNVIVGSNSVIKSGSIIGDNVIIDSGSVIGCNGFQMVKDENGVNMTIPHIGRVLIGDNVSIGSNVSIARSLFDGFTFIGNNTKINNLVHIAHNCTIGDNCVITANCTMFGSSELKSNVWLAPNSCIMNRVVVGKNAFIGASALVNRDVPEGWTMIGIPARRLEKK